jgi:hypothetical protein
MTTPKKRTNENTEFNNMVDSFSKKVSVFDFRLSDSRDQTVEIDVCWKWLEQSHPIIYNRILHRGHPNSTLFRAYVSNVYRGLRLVRPDAVQLLGTVDSVSGNCRAFGRIVDRFPCLFE